MNECVKDTKKQLNLSDMLQDSFSGQANREAMSTKRHLKGLFLWSGSFYMGSRLLCNVRGSWNKLSIVVRGNESLQLESEMARYLS